MKFTNIWFVALCLLLTACGSAEQIETPFSAENQVEEVDEIEPVNIDVALDNSHSVSAVIPITGGSLTTTGADGTIYTLEIPGDALVYETEITMTPAEFSGLPAGFEPGPGVQLEPEGLSLYNFATLTITPASEIPIDQQVFFGAEADGQNLSLALPEIDSSEIKILLLHFSVDLVGKGSLSAIDPALTKQGSAVVEGLNNKIAELTQRERQRQALEGRKPLAPDYWTEMARLFQEYYDNFVKGNVDRAGESCSKGSKALSIYAHYTKLMRKLNLQDHIVEIDQLALLEKVDGLCLQEEYKLCVDKHVVHRMATFLFSLERKWQIIRENQGFGEERADSALLRLARQLTEQCLRFELQFTSTSIGPTCSGDSGVSGKVEVTVSANIPIYYANFNLFGNAPLVLESFEYIPCPLFDEHISNYEEGTIHVNLAWKVEGLNLDLIGNAEKPKLSILLLMDARETYHPIIEHGISDWYFVFLDLHRDQRCGPLGTGNDLRVQAFCLAPLMNESEFLPENESSGWVFLDWEIVGGKLFAVLDWHKTLGANSETGSMLLYHRPGE